MPRSSTPRSLLGAFALTLLACAGAVACGGDDGEGSTGAGATAAPGGESSSSSSSSSGGAAGVGATNGKLPTGACAISQDITKSTTWSAATCPDGVLVKYSLEVRGAGVELTIEPGTTVKLAASGSLTIEDGAALIARGTADRKIVFDGSVTGDGSWMGLRFTSNSPKNELSHVIVRHAGSKEEMRAAVSASKEGVLTLSDMEIADNARFGIALFDDAKLTMNRTAIRRNALGVSQMGVPYIKYLKGEGNVFEENGGGNAVIVEATSLYTIKEDTTWPSLAPAVYRIAGQNGANGGIVEVEHHLVIEPGAVFEMAGGSGFLMSGGTSGLRAVGTAGEKIVFRGIGGSSWSGLTFGESSWSENRLEHVDVQGASSAPSWGYYGTGNPSTPKAGILLGYNLASTVKVALKDFHVAGPNNAPSDVAVKGAAVLTQEPGVSGTGPAGALAVSKL